MANRKAKITVDWPIANLQATLDVEAPEIRTSFSISIEGLVEDTLDGGYPYIPSSDTSALYKIDLTDNLGTTDAEWIEKYNEGQLTFKRESSYVSIVTSNGALYMRMVTKGTTSILERTITATIANDGHGSAMSATTSYRHPPFGATITIRNYEVVHNSSAVTLVNSGVFFNVEMRISGTNGSYFTEEEFFKLVYLGIYKVVYGSSSSNQHINYDLTNRQLYIFVDASSTAISVTYNLYQAWNGDSNTTTAVSARNWYPVSTYTTFCLVMLFSTSSTLTSGSSLRYEAGSNMYIDISSTWTAGTDSDEAQPNTYGKHVYSQDLKDLYDKRPSTFSSGYYPYILLGIHDSRITAKHLNEFIDAEYSVRTQQYSRLTNCACYIRSFRYKNAEGNPYLFYPSLYTSNTEGEGWYSSGTGYIDDDANGVEILTIGYLRYLDTARSGWSYTIASNLPTYDYISLSFYHRAEVEQNTGEKYHNSYYVYLDFSDNAWESSYAYGVSSKVVEGSPYQLMTYKVNNDM